ncbi:AAA family ATPase [Pelomonas sp. Root1217]|uniref:AAA family ATPase n=1 Tax=Pelomonas sp. Root1217 TaxID=1736430 RepID=UPI0009E8B565|nr:AAA family ATPase [Pelomonas sp. Root1217]
MAKTLLKKLSIRKFRALTDVDIEFGTHVTVICGKNGTSKSSILGIAAQIFSFETDYTQSSPLQFQTIAGGKFKSLPAEHFRFSDQFDTPGSMTVGVELFDGYTAASATAELELSKRGKIARPVVRKNSTVVTTGNTSRNFTHPVIFLSLKRLLPIASRDYQVHSFAYLNANKQQFLNLTNELLNKTSSAATSTAGSINSAVAHADNYDQDSVSAGEDNAGQIMLALMSFRKLKEEYTDYKGGLLLIDEADAGLFPAAQIKLIEILNRECHDLDLQVVMTSHSPSLIEYTFEQSQKFRRRFKTIYLSDTYGSVQAMHDMSWADISADLHTRTVTANADVSLPSINVYFEDREGFDLFNAALYRKPIKKFTNPLENITLGCSNYIQLIQKGIPEFASKSIVCLDADVANAAQYSSIVLLPGSLPPDQLIFEFLYNLPANHSLWTNPLRFNRPVLTRIAAPIIAALSISGPTANVAALVTAYRAADPSGKKLRELFKSFYKDAEFQAFLNQRKSALNPWRTWVQANKTECDAFTARFVAQMISTMADGYNVDRGKLVALN